MKTQLLCLMLGLMLVATGLFAQDLGGSITNTSTLTTESSMTITDNIEASLFWRPKIGDYSRFRFEAAFTQPFSTDADAQALLPQFPFTLDINSLFYSGKFPRLGPELPVTSFEIGRFNFSDPTGYILANKLDGVRFGFTFPAMEIHFGLGYSGLLWRQTSGIMMSKTDQIASIDEDQLFGSQRLIGSVRYTVFNIFRQQLILSFLFQEDFRDIWNSSIFLEPGTEEEDPSKGGPVDTQYLTLTFRGSFIPNLYYNVFGVFGSGRVMSFMPDSDSETGGSYQYSTKLSFLTGIKLNYYLKEFMYSLFALEFVYASGDKDSTAFLEGNREGFAMTYLPITPYGLGAIFSPNMGNISYGQFIYSLKPFGSSNSYALTNLQLMARVLTFFRSQPDGPISEEADIASHDSPYLGSEVDVSVNFRPFSDLGSSLTFGAFFPSNQFEESSTRLLVKLKVSFSF